MPFFGIDIGGTNGRVAVYADLDSINELEVIVFSVTNHYESDLAKLVTTCQQLEQRYGTIEGVGLAVAGKVNRNRTSLTGAGNLTDWVGQPVAAQLANALGTLVVLGNDAEAAALAEAYYGHGQREGFWFMIWGTGVGGCQVHYDGDTPIALPGEPGHAALVAHGTKCSCGQYGCLEAYVGGDAIERRFGVPAPDLSEPYWTRVIDWMSEGIHNITLTQPTGRVILSGGVAVGQAHRLSVIEANLRDSVKVTEPPKVLLSRFGAGAGTIGALALIRL